MMEYTTFPKDKATGRYSSIVKFEGKTLDELNATVKQWYKTRPSLIEDGAYIVDRKWLSWS